MLVAWRDFLSQVDPDIVIGYNISGFDFPYLMDRAKHLKATEFPYLGRLKSKLRICCFYIGYVLIIFFFSQDPSKGNSFLVQSIWPA